MYIFINRMIDTGENSSLSNKLDIHVDRYWNNHYLLLHGRCVRNDRENYIA